MDERDDLSVCPPGAGAKQVRELIAQSAYISQHLSADELTSSGSVLPLVNKVSELITSAGMPVENFGVPSWAASFRGSTAIWAMETAAKNGRARRKLIKFWPCVGYHPGQWFMHSGRGDPLSQRGDYAET